MKKAQLSIYLDQEVFASLEAYAKRQDKPKSLVAEAAIASFLSPDDSDRREAAIAKRLDRIVRVLERLERNDGVTLETIALFIPFLADVDTGASGAFGRGGAREGRRTLRSLCRSARPAPLQWFDGAEGSQHRTA